MNPNVPDFLAQLRQIVGAQHVRVGEAALSFHTDERNRYHHAPLAVVLPENSAQIAAIVTLCAAQTPVVAVIAQGGNTGLVGGCAVLAHTPSILLNLTRLQRIITVDALNQTMTVQAGATLADVQSAAAAHGLLFPLSLASESAATIGGNLSTNAGGTQVLRYGTMRDLCLGLEVVLPNGEILSALNTLRKNNTGYDLKQLFIGAEGTLGIITAAVLKLYPQPTQRTVALLAAPDMTALMRAFTALRARYDAQLTAFELIAPHAMDLVCTHLRCAHPWAQHKNLPLSTPLNAPFSALIEIIATHNDAHEIVHDTDAIHESLQSLVDAQLLTDALLAQSESQAQHLWQLREQISAAQKAQGKNIKHDISVPISAISEFVHATADTLQTHYAGIQTVIFGHLGDGNLHFNVSAGTAFADSEALMQHETAINAIVYAQVQQFNGSISAEHGIGLLKREHMRAIKSPVELELMRTLKRTLDPLNVLNPHKVLPA